MRVITAKGDFLLHEDWIQISAGPLHKSVVEAYLIPAVELPGGVMLVVWNIEPIFHCSLDQN